MNFFKISNILIFLIVLGIFFAFMRSNFVSKTNVDIKDNAQWKKVLTAEQYHVLREGGTDTPFTHKEILNNHEQGTYVTADCNEPVFRSEDKFDSGTGWPSFTKPIKEGAVILKEETSFGIVRTEVLGTKCGGHLGHVFDDGPTALPDGRQATGKRYCINASALKFIPDNK